MKAGFLKHNQIDRSQWDDCVQKLPEARIYMLSGYLDKVWPGWGGYVLFGETTYDFVIPVPSKSFFLYKKVYQPFFSQQYTLQGIDNTSAFFDSYFTFIQKYAKTVVQCFDVRPSIQLENFSCEERVNMEMKMPENTSAFMENINKNRLRELRKAEKAQLTLRRSEDIKDVFRCVDETIPDALTTKSKKALNNLYKWLKSENLANLYITTDQSGNIHASGLFTFYKNRLTYLIGASTVKGRESGASTFLFKEVMTPFFGKEYVMDFEGSNIEGVARFYESLGGSKVSYVKISQ